MRTGTRGFLCQGKLVNMLWLIQYSYLALPIPTSFSKTSWMRLTGAETDSGSDALEMA